MAACSRSTKSRVLFVWMILFGIFAFKQFPSPCQLRTTGSSVESLRSRKPTPLMERATHEQIASFFIEGAPCAQGDP